jgi:hypothetical protein
MAFAAEVLDVRQPASEKVIDGYDRIAFGKQGIAKVGA